MSETIGEQALKALALVLDGIAGPKVERNGVEPEAATTEGTVNLLDGDLGEPEYYLGQPPAFGFTHKAEIVFYIKGRKADERDAAFDALKQSIVAALEGADETLGDVVEGFYFEALESETEPVKGGASIKAGQFSVVLEYVSSSRLG